MPFIFLKGGMAEKSSTLLIATEVPADLPTEKTDTVNK